MWWSLRMKLFRYGHRSQWKSSPSLPLSQCLRVPSLFIGYFQPPLNGFLWWKWRDKIHKYMDLWFEAIKISIFFTSPCFRMPARKNFIVWFKSLFVFMLLHKYGTIDKLKCVSGFASATHRGSVVKRAVNRQDLSVPSFDPRTNKYTHQHVAKFWYANSESQI